MRGSLVRAQAPEQNKFNLSLNFIVPGYRLLNAVSDADFIELIATSNTFAEVASKVGIKSRGGGVTAVSNRVRDMGLCTRHFNNWNSKKNVPTAELLVYGSARDNQTIKKRIINEALIPYKCAVCSNEGIHNGMPLTLHMDHKDGDNLNNVLSNLRFLCPNCHSQTETYGGRNNKGRRRKHEQLAGVESLPLAA